MQKVLIVLVVLSAIVFGILHFHGFFTTPKVSEEKIGPYTIATTKYVGDYSKVSSAMTEIESWLKDRGIPFTKGVGLYHDDPAKVDKNNLRSDVGYILDDFNDETISTIESKYEVSVISKTDAVIAEFPIKSTLSYVIGPMKVYPVINKYFSEKGYAKNNGGYTIEIYDIPNKTMRFIIPIAGDKP
jgi:hypothetical protein